jgi:hypothetical protein
MTKGFATLLGGVGLGAALMFLFDAESGRRRRAFARDKAAKTYNHARRAVVGRSRDLSNRTRGLVARARAQGRRLHAVKRQAEESQPAAHS